MTAEPFTAWSAQVIASTDLFNALAVSAGLLAVRVVLGLLMAAHGAQKLLGWFGGYGLGATGGFFEQLGFRPGRLFAAVAAGTEIASGVLVALGLFGPVDWLVVVVAAPASLVGGFLGARIATRIPATPLRVLIVGFGVAVSIYLFARA